MLPHPAQIDLTDPPEAMVPMGGTSQISQRDTAWFTLKFGVTWLFLYGLVVWLPPSSFFDPLNRVTALLMGLLLAGNGLEPSVQGPLVSAGGFSVRIIPECTGVFAALLFFSFVIASAARWQSKAAGLCLGIPVLFSAFLVMPAVKVASILHTSSQYLLPFILWLLLPILCKSNRPLTKSES